MNFREIIERLNWFHFFVLILLHVQFDVLSKPDVGDLHLVQCQRSSLVRADISSSAHDLTSRKLFDVVLILKHFFLRVGQGNHHGKRQTLWNGDNDNSHTDDDVCDP